MAEDVVIAKFKADVSELKRQLDEYLAKLGEVTVAEKDNQTELDKLLARMRRNFQQTGKLAAITAADVKRVGIPFDQLQKKIKEAFSKTLPQAKKQVEELGKQVEVTTDKIGGDFQQVKEKTSQSFDEISSKVKSSLRSIGAAFGIVFSIGAVVQFGKAAIDAFLQAEKEVNRLRFAVIDLGGASEAAFDRLIRQSRALQEATNFSSGVIQQAQAALSAFGLSASQIEQLIPGLADFATVLGVDIASAADKVGQGLQGVGRDFKRFGIEVSATNTPLENLNNIMEGFSKRAGAAANDADTFAGKLKDIEDESEDTARAIGEDLIPVWISLKNATLQATKALIDYIKFSGPFGGVKRFAQTIDIDSTDVEKVTDKVDELTEANIKAGQSAKEASDNAIKSIKDEIEQRIALRKEQEKTLLARTDESDREIRESARLSISLAEAELVAINKVIEAKKKESDEDDKILKAEQLRGKSLEELNRLLEENNKRNDIVSQSNVILINRQIELQKRQIEERIRNEDLLRALQIANLKDERVRREAQFAEEIKQVKATGQLRADIIRELQIRLNNDLAELDRKESEIELAELKKRDTAFFDSIEQRKKRSKELADAVSKIQREQFIDETKPLPLPERKKAADSQAVQIQADALVEIKKLDQDETLSFEDKSNQKIIITQRTTKAIKQLYEDLAVPLEELGQSELQIWLEKNEGILEQTEVFLDSLSRLYAAFGDRRIDQISRETDAQLEALDKASEASQSDLDRRFISEEQFKNKQIEIEAEKVKAQEEADKKIRSIKRQQANIEKLSALLSIAVTLAKGIAAIDAQIAILAANPVTAALAANAIAQKAILIGSTALQVGAVLSAPVPYEKGTKDAKKGRAIVDEKGEEAIVKRTGGRVTTLERGDKVVPFRPSKKHELALDAMVDDRFEDYVLKYYVTPRLEKQRDDFERDRQQTFAKNISESIIVNAVQSGKGDFYLEKMSRSGVPVSNTDDLARAIARELMNNQLSPYRR